MLTVWWSNSSIQWSGESGEQVRPDYWCHRSSPGGRLRPDLGRWALYAPWPWTATPPLNHLHKTPHHIHPGWDTVFEGHNEPAVSPFAWKISKIILYYFTQNSDSICHQCIEVKFWASIIKETQMYQVNDFSACVYKERCKSLLLLNFFLSYAY